MKTFLNFILLSFLTLGFIFFQSVLLMLTWNDLILVLLRGGEISIFPCVMAIALILSFCLLGGFLNIFVRIASK